MRFWQTAAVSVRLSDVDSFSAQRLCCSTVTLSISPDYEDDLTDQSVDEEQLVSEHRGIGLQRRCRFWRFAVAAQFGWLQWSPGSAGDQCWYAIMKGWTCCAMVRWTDGL